MSEPRPSLHHIALTVTDLDVSIPWYEGIFGIKLVNEVPHDGGTGMVLTDEAGRLGFVLHRHDSNEGETFSETRTGLDHVGLRVPDRDALVRWQEHLERQGVVRSDSANRPLTQSPIADTPYGSVLVFRDPDNIQLELFSPAG